MYLRLRPWSATWYWYFSSETSVLGQGTDKQGSKIKAARTWYIAFFNAYFPNNAYFQICKSYLIIFITWFTCEITFSFGLVCAVSAPSYSAFLELALRT